MRIARLAAVILFAPLFLGLGCSSPQEVKIPFLQDVNLSENQVTFSTDEAALASVRYGFESGKYDRVAYPVSAARRDKSFRTTHQIPLLSVKEGDTVYLQLLTRTSDNRAAQSGELVFSVGKLPAAPSILSWTMIDVGFGDSHLLTMPTTGTRILIDAGETSDLSNVDTYLRSAGVTRLDVMLGTHLHMDHIGGMVGDENRIDDGIAGTYEIGVFLDTPDKSNSVSSFTYQAYLNILETLAAREVPVDTIRVGDTSETVPALRWDPAVRVEVLNSGHGSEIGGSSTSDKINNDSIVIRLSYGDVNLMMGGDSESPVELKLARDHGSDLDSEVLKIHHHGLQDASTGMFVTAVNPRVGMIPLSLVEWSGSDPHSATLAILSSVFADAYSLDRAGTLGIVPNREDSYNVTLITDGISYEVQYEPSQSFFSPAQRSLGAHSCLEDGDQ